MEISWDRFEPRQGVWDDTYIARMKKKKWAFETAGMKVVLECGLQYPPKWVWAVRRSLLRQPTRQFIFQKPVARHELVEHGVQRENAGLAVHLSETYFSGVRERTSSLCGLAADGLAN